MLLVDSELLLLNERDPGLHRVIATAQHGDRGVLALRQLPVRRVVIRHAAGRAQQPRLNRGGEHAPFTPPPDLVAFRVEHEEVVRESVGEEQLQRALAVVRHAQREIDLSTRANFEHAAQRLSIGDVLVRHS